MTSSVRLGVLTPSSNTALEPLTSARVQSWGWSTAYGLFALLAVTALLRAATALEKLSWAGNRGG